MTGVSPAPWRGESRDSGSEAGMTGGGAGQERGPDRRGADVAPISVVSEVLRSLSAF